MIFLPVYIFFVFRLGASRIFLWEALVASIAARFLLAEPLKWLIQKKRPYEVWRAVSLIGDSPGSAFPSGHAAFFFSLATTAFLYDIRWGSIFLLGALIISISRMIAGVHWESDIIAGAIIGIVVSLAVHLFF